MREELITLARPKPRYGYRRLWAVFAKRGRKVNVKHTMHRLLEEHGERRDQLHHPAYQQPELIATWSSQAGHWDITKLRGPANSTSTPATGRR